MLQLSSEEFPDPIAPVPGVNPGMGSYPDCNMKLWQNGVRIFKGLSNFKVYHFGSISLRKKKTLSVNNGTRTFLKKWKI